MSLGAAAKQAVETAFGAHHILPGCARVITWTGKKKDLLMIEGTDSSGAPVGATVVPGHVQFLVDLPAGQDSITMKMDVRQTSLGGLMMSASPDLVLAVGPTGQPITWVPDSDNVN